MREKTRSIRAQALFAVLLLASGCSSAKFIPTGPSYDARTDNCHIQVFSSKQPEREYEELGILEGEGSWGEDTLGKILPKMKRKAYRAGGDAIILMTNQKTVIAWDDTSDEKLYVTATVIRWSD